MRIDLHTHSRASDGTDTPGELVRAAAAAGLDVVALTDHDTADGWAEAAAVAEQVGIEVVPGMEISTNHRGRGVHLLAYYVDPTYPPLVTELERILHGRAARVPTMIARLNALGIEITEDAAMADAGQTIDFMEHVRATGCAFALDDFGAGATGFRHFRDFRFDMVKIDGGFARGVHGNRDAQVLVESLAAIARHFEMLTVAEQVESEAEAGWLRAAGIDCLQGYLYGRPAARPALAPDARRLAS